jgi:predicted permease
MPAGFAFPHGTETLDTLGKSTDIWVPWVMTPQERASWEDGSGNAIARLRLGVPIQQAQAEMRAISARLDPLRAPPFRGATSVVRPLDVSVTGASRRVLLIFMAAVLLVLLIACSNVAGLVLARATGRAMEIGLRTALGASRLRLVRQLLAESLSLAGAGGILGMLTAFVTVRLLVHSRLAKIPRLDETSIDWRVLLFTAGVCLATVVLFGLVPALSVSRCNLNEVLKHSGSRTVKGAAGRLQRGLTIAEVALTFVLLAGSGLLIRSLLKVESVDKGFTPSSTVTMSVQLDARYNQPEGRSAFFRGLIERAKALPGVAAVGAINHLPLGGGEGLVNGLEVEGRPTDEKTLFEDRSITPGYFAAMGIPLSGGRPFTDDDSAGRPRVAIVSRRFAKTYFPGQDAVGKHFRYSGNLEQIVGVVGDVRHLSLEATPPMQIYVPMWQGGVNSVSVVVRTSRAPDQVAADIRSLVRALDPAVAVADVRTMSDLVSGATAERRFQTLLLTAFGGLALFLSLVGLYALMAYSVEQRTAEIGIRMALGAPRASVLRLVLRQGASLALAGIVLGGLCAWAVTRSMASLLFEVAPADAPAFLGAALLFCAVALAACYMPARRATLVDPATTLRAE